MESGRRPDMLQKKYEATGTAGKERGRSEEGGRGEWLEWEREAKYHQAPFP